MQKYEKGQVHDGVCYIRRPPAILCHHLQTFLKMRGDIHYKLSSEKNNKNYYTRRILLFYFFTFRFLFIFLNVCECFACM